MRFERNWTYLLALLTLALNAPQAVACDSDPNLLFEDSFESGSLGRWGAPLLTTCRVNAGSGADYVDTSGRTWDADQEWTGTGWGFEGGNAGHTTQPIDGTEDDALYQWEHNSAAAYHFDLPSETYCVTLHFAEIAFPAPNQRAFDVLLEGSLVLDDFDIFAVTGGRYIAYEQFFLVDVSDGTLDVGFIDEIDVNQISAFEILTCPSGG